MSRQVLLRHRRPTARSGTIAGLLSAHQGPIARRNIITGRESFVYVRVGVDGHLEKVYNSFTSPLPAEGGFDAVIAGGAD
jgi:hypothetical protein